MASPVIVPRQAVGHLVARAWLVTALVDGLFASALSRFGYGSTATRLWQGVAGTLLGPSAFEGGLETALLGIVMHIGVALWWSSVFVGLVLAWPALRRALAKPTGVIAIAAVYGPLVWMVMSLLVIPTLTSRPMALSTRWWIQLVGHVFFVALPMAAVVAHALRRMAGAPVPQRDATAA